VYFVVLAPYVNACASGLGCASSDFCAYHTYLNDAGENVMYAVMPTLSAGAGRDPKDCQWDGNARLQTPNGDAGDLLVSSLSHEDNETITNPLLNAWYVSSTRSEDGDMCSSTGPFAPDQGENPLAYRPVLGGSASAGTLYDQVLSGDRYYLQSEWSNGAGGCALRPGKASLTSAFTASINGTSVQLNPAATTSSGGYSSETWDFGDGSPSAFTADPGHPAEIAHTFPGPGVYNVSLTVVDRLGNLATADARLVVGTAGSALVISHERPPEPAATAARAPRTPRRKRRAAGAHRRRHRAPR
jgi:PKD repeat protein